MYNNIKVRVPNKDIYEKIQLKLFEEGCGWLSSGKELLHEYHPYLFVDDLYKYITHSNCEKIFLQAYQKEISWEEIVEDKFELKAGEHVVKINGKYYLVLKNETGVFGKRIEGISYYSSLKLDNVEAVYKLPEYRDKTFDKNYYESATPIWPKLDVEREALKKSYAELCDQINELKAKAEEIKEKL